MVEDAPVYGPSPDKPHWRRRIYYNPILDPRTREVKMKPLWVEKANGYKDGGPLNAPDADHPHNLISSLCEDGKHRLALDVDKRPDDWEIVLEVFVLGGPHRGVVWAESSTPGHWHLYVPGISYDWRQYAGILALATQHKLIDGSYLLASLNRGQTLLRPPHVRKETF